MAKKTSHSTQAKLLARPLTLAQQELAAIEDRLWKNYPRFTGADPTKTRYGRGSAKTAAAPDEALLTYALLKDKTAIFAVTRTDFRLSTVAQSRDQVASAIRAVRRRMEQVATAGTLRLAE